MSSIERVHVIFKTHLDVGFTDLSKNVIQTYVDEYIPRALNLAEQRPGEFLWTTGSWLIHHYLKVAGAADRKRMEEAIEAGRIAWHALPFTMHSELADERLFEFGLSLSKELDRRFGKQTVAAKMTDVPGHTLAVARLLAKNGVEFFHIGVNPGSAVPQVPPVFRWRTADGTEVIVAYHDSYGEALCIEGLPDALVFAHTHDNHGPQAAEALDALYADLRVRFPGAEIGPSTMDAFARKLGKVKEQLPVVSEEIGDTWIHGIGTDPLKVAQFRALLRCRDAWLEAGKLADDSAIYKEFSEWLLLVPEHTWGVDIKTYLTDYVNYAKGDFVKARSADKIPLVLAPKGCEYVYDWARKTRDEKCSYSFVEQSWQEQRDYVTKAMRALPRELEEEASEALAALCPSALLVGESRAQSEDRTTGKATMTQTETEVASVKRLPLVAGESYSLGLFDVTWDNTGAISQLCDATGRDWAGSAIRLGVYTYEVFDAEDYRRWYQDYCSRGRTEYETWITCDFGKPGIESLEPPVHHRTVEAVARGLVRWEQGDCDIVRAELQLPEWATLDAGAPAQVVVEYAFSKTSERIDIRLDCLHKDAYRLPEASWFSFGLNVDHPTNWQLHKLGEWVSPVQVVRGGNRNLHALGRGLRYNGADGSALIETLDAPLVAVGAPGLLRFDRTIAQNPGIFHFNLHNNVWGTNFPMWFEGDMRYRFRVSLLRST